MKKENYLMGLLKKVVKKIIKPLVNNYKGKVGESKVNSQLNPLIFGRVKHKQINNLILVDDNGKSHQIDHIEVRQNGIFCIETKNYIVLILGGENQSKWTQCLYNGEKHQFINPLKQNKYHIYYVNNVLEGKYKINSLVVMVQNNADYIKASNVINLANLREYLKNYDDGNYYTIEEMEDIYNQLLNAGTKISNKEHIANIRKTQMEIEEGICPRCGGRLVEREGRYGKFWGCSNYLNCTFTLKQK